MTECPHGGDPHCCPPCQAEDVRPRRLRNGLVTTAKFPSLCRACDGDVFQGDRIVQADQGGWIHDTCAEVTA